MTHESSRIHEIGRIVALCFAATLIVEPAAAVGDGTSGGRLTAVIGEAAVANEPIEPEAYLREGASITTGDDGNLAMLVDEDTVVELCAKTEMKLMRDEETGSRIIEVGAGTTRIIVDPNADVGKLQIVTPAWVATLMGTVVYVTVDPTTGESTLVSEDHAVNLKSSDPNIKGNTVVNGNQKLTMRPGDAPPEKPEDIDQDELDKISECLKDIHGAAVANSKSGSSKAEDRLAAVDGNNLLLPFPPFDPLDPSNDPLGEGPNDPDIEPPNLIPIDDLLNPGDDLGYPEPCGDIPGDGCFPFPQPNSE
jgi:hypothetical protein